MTITWIDIYACNWYELSEADLAAWEDQIRRNLPGITAKELEDGVTRLAETWPTNKSDGTRNYPPKVRDLISEIRIKRSKMAESFESSCIYCGGSGWMLAPVTIANNRVRAIGWQGFQGCYYGEQRIPCKCAAGKTVAETIICKRLHSMPGKLEPEMRKLGDNAREAAGCIDQMHWKERLRYLHDSARLYGQESDQMDEYLKDARSVAGIVSKTESAFAR